MRSCRSSKAEGPARASDDREGLFGGFGSSGCQVRCQTEWPRSRGSLSDCRTVEVVSVADGIVGIPWTAEDCTQFETAPADVAARESEAEPLGPGRLPSSAE